MKAQADQSASLRIAIVAAEVAPYAKVGGLADVVSSLPRAMAALGAEPVTIVPGHRALLSELSSELVAERLTVKVGENQESFAVRRATSGRQAPLLLIDHPGYFGRDEIYGEKGREYPDNLRRFIFFGRAAAVAAAQFIRPHVIHAHDWHAAVAPLVIRADPALRAQFERTTSVFTIHNLAFQGIFEPADFGLLNLDWSHFSIECLEFYGRVNLMKGAVVMADGVSTVSPSYAREISSDPKLGFGLEGVLRHKGERFIGILNGADYEEWNPATDRLIAARYSGERPEGKRECARWLRQRLHLAAPQGAPIIGMITRMTAQKGIYLLRDGLDRIMATGAQLVMLSSGEPELEQFFSKAEQRYAGRLRVVLGFDNALAHQIQAGADIFLMPSQFEPCGLTQMYALKYGTVPVARATGGIRDTLSEFNPSTGSGNGFLFEPFRVEELLAALSRALQTWQSPSLWRKLMANCFAADFSWSRAAGQYLKWFERLRAERATCGDH